MSRIVRLRPDDHVRGRRDAPVTLVEYGDYECPACGEAAPVVDAVLAEIGDEVCFAFRNFPLSTIHPHAELAAEAAEAAADQGAFWAMHDALFARQEALEPGDLLAYAAAVGIDAERVEEALRTRAKRDRVRGDLREGVRAGVNGTPTFFLDGARWDGPVDVASLFDALATAARR